MKARGTLHKASGRWSLTHYDTNNPRPILPWVYGTEQEMQEYRDTHVDDAARHPELFFETSTVPPTVPAFANVYRILYAIFALMDQSITDVRELPDRRSPARKRKQPQHPVTIIQLRRREAHGTTDKTTGRFLACRFRHTRTLARPGPAGRAAPEFRPHLINDYLRGPDDAPISTQRGRVSTLSR